MAHGFSPCSAIAEHGRRVLWGAWWHQINRYLVSNPVRSLAGAVGLSIFSLLGYYFLTTTAFFSSSVMHMGLIPPQPLNTRVSVAEMRLRIAVFFWAQIQAIDVELVVSKILRHPAPRFPRSPLAKVATVMWVVMCFALILPILTVPFESLGTGMYIQYSQRVQGLLGREWLTWSFFVKLRPSSPDS